MRLLPEPAAGEKPVLSGIKYRMMHYNESKK
jgi:hypothetical protein